jgi:ABC-2 type transport system ATP-binding protein
MIKLQNISKAFAGRPVLKNLSLQVPSGRIVGLLGGNGSGKTTTLRIILGFLKPDSGQVSVGDYDSVVDASAVQKQIAYIPENVALYPELTGDENLSYFASLTGTRLSVSERKALFEKVNLSLADSNRRLGQYSKGMRQRVALAIALAKNARVLLLDEPTTGLDPSAMQQLATLLRELSREGAAILLTTHDLWHLSLDTDEVGILRDGELADYFQAEELDVASLAQRYLKG